MFETLAKAVPGTFLGASILAIVVPPLRPSGLGRGLLLAWIVTFLAAMAVAFTNTGSWAIDCGRGGVVVGGYRVGQYGPCVARNDLPPELIAIPPLIGLAILLAWTWRHPPPGRSGMGSFAVLLVLSGLVVAGGHLDVNVALLLIVVMAGAAYAWPRLRDRPQP